MALKKNRQKKWAALFKRSKILSFFLAVATSLYNKAACSLTGKIFTAYDEHADEKSVICRLFGRLNTGKRVFRPVKRTVSRLVSKSLIIEKTDGFLKGWLYTRLNVYGLIAITAGVGSSLLQLLKTYGFKSSPISFADMFISVLFVLLSIPLMLSQTPLNEAVCGSKGSSSLLFGWLGCKKEVFEEKNVFASHNKTALPIGVLFCVLSWWIRPLMLVIGFVAFILALAVLYIPETGIVCLVLLVPFLSTQKLALFITYITVCFLLKYVRGKRTVKFDPLSTSVLALAILFVPYSHSVSTGVLGVCTYFLVINLIKSKKWIGRCVTSLVFAVFLTGLYGLFAYFAYEFEIDYFVYLLKADPIDGMASVFSSPSVFACYIVMSLPLVAGAGKKRGKGAVAFFAVVFGCVCLFLTDSRRALLSLLVGAVIFMVLYSKNALASIGVMLCALPFVFINLPTVFLDKGQYTRLSEYIVDEMFGRLHGHVNIISVASVFLFCLTLFLCVQKNITLYSKGCSENGRLTSLGAMAGVAAFLMMGINAVVYTEYKTALMFWIILGIASCVSGTERSNTIRYEYSEYEYSKGDLI